MKLEEWQFAVVIIGTILTTILSVLGACIGFFKFFGKAIVRPWIEDIADERIALKEEDFQATYNELSYNVQRYKREFRGKRDQFLLEISNLKLKLGEMDFKFLANTLIIDRIHDINFSLEKSLDDMIKYWQHPQEWKDRRGAYRDRQNLSEKRKYKEEMNDISILKNKISNPSCDIYSQSGDLSTEVIRKRNPADFDSSPPMD